MSNTCAAKGCRTVIAGDKLMCTDHWRHVPKHLQQDINRYWRESRQRGNNDRLYAINKYRAARTLAITFVEQLSPLI